MKLKTKISNIKYNIEWWFRNKSPIYINTLNYKLLFEDWWYDDILKKYFKRPKLKFVYKYRDYTCCLIPPIFRLQINCLGWKTKYGDYRHESNPSITLSMLGYTFVFEMKPETNDGEDISTQYYETVLLFHDYIKKYDNHAEAIYMSIFNNTWLCGIDDPSEINCVDMLTSYGRCMYGSYKAHLTNNRNMQASGI